MRYISWLKRSFTFLKDFSALFVDLLLIKTRIKKIIIITNISIREKNQDEEKILEWIVTLKSENVFEDQIMTSTYLIQSYIDIYFKKLTLSSISKSSSLSTDSSGKMEIFWHDSDSLGMDGAEISVFKESD